MAVQNDMASQPGSLSESQNKQAWRYVHLLVLMQALGAASAPIIISLGGLVGESLAANKSLSVLPVSLYNIGLALSMLPVAFLIRRLGRQRTYILGASCVCVGGMVAAMGILNASFAMFCVGTALAGCYGACVQTYRFAVTDYIPKPQQPQAISRVMLGGLAAAVIGPQLVIWTKDLMDPPMAASFMSQSFLALLAIPVLLQMGRFTAGLPVQGQRDVRLDATLPEHERPRPLWQIAITPKFMATAFAGLVSYGLMTFMMTATPLAMSHAGHSLSVSTLGIQWHILSMYAPSLVTGKLIDRFGKYKITVLGLVLIASAGLMSMSGEGTLHFWGGLILLGVGWNFGFIGATSMVTDCYRPSERAKVQALNDTLVFGTTATMSLLSGQLLYTMGWVQLNMLLMPPIVVALLLLFLQSRRERRAGPGFRVG